MTAVDHGVLERFLLQRARVEAVKRGILQQLGLTEAPRPPPARNRSSAASVIDDDGRSVMAAYRRTVAQTRHHVVSNDVVGNDVVDDVTGNDVMHGDAPSAMQFYSFKGHGKQINRSQISVNYCIRISVKSLLSRMPTLPIPGSQRHAPWSTVFTVLVCYLYALHAAGSLG